MEDNNIIKGHYYRIVTVGKYNSFIFFIGGYRRNNQVQSWHFFGRIYNQGFICETYFKSTEATPDLYYKIRNDDTMEIYAKVDLDYPSIAYLQITNRPMELVDLGTDVAGLTSFFN